MLKAILFVFRSPLRNRGDWILGREKGVNECVRGVIYSLGNWQFKIRFAYKKET